MNIVFFGSSKYSTIVANSLWEETGLTAVVTLPDTAIGRHKIITPNPVKSFALKNNITFITANKLDAETIAKISVLRPDFLVIADYGRILPEELLKLPKYAALNVHHSLLPKYRGPSPAPSAILAGVKTSGVTIIEMNQKIDAGDILAQEKYPLKNNETTESLLTTLNTIGSNILIPVFREYIQKKIKRIQQDQTSATFTKKLEKANGFIDSNNPPTLIQIDRMIRAYYPWPTAWTKLELNPNKWKIVKLLPENKIQVEGGKPMSVKDFLNGYPQLEEKLKKLLSI